MRDHEVQKRAQILAKKRGYATGGNGWWGRLSKALKNEVMTDAEGQLEAEERINNPPATTTPRQTRRRRNLP